MPVAALVDLDPGVALAVRVAAEGWCAVIDADVDSLEITAADVLLVAADTLVSSVRTLRETGGAASAACRVVVAVATGQDASVAAEHALQAGADDTLCEPFCLTDVRARLRAAARLARAEQARSVAERERVRAERALADITKEQSSLRRVSTAVAAGDPLGEVFAHAAREAAFVTGCDGAHVAYLEESGRGTLVGVHHTSAMVSCEVGTQLGAEDSATARALATGRPRRNDEHVSPVDGVASGVCAWRSSLAVPIRVQGGLWGAIGVVSARPAGIPSGTERRLARFAELVGLAVGNAQSSAETRRRALRDYLTGLSNRRAFEESLEAELEFAQRHRQPVTLLLLDLDHFKVVNDTLGHQAGDTVLVTTASRMCEVLSQSEMLARVGGEEFGVVLPRTDAEAGFVIAERLRRAIGETEFPGVGTVTVSIGLAEAGSRSTVDGLFRDADEALYRAKSGGRNRVEVTA